MSAVLQEVDVERRPAVARDLIVSSRQKWHRENRRPPSLTAREALQALQFEALFVWTLAAGIRHGDPVTDADFQRLTEAVRWVNFICDEVIR